jgi:hypothetical protein
MNEMLDGKWKLSTASPQKGDSSKTNDFGTTFSHAKHLKLFRTLNGYLGLGSECIGEGDSLWILPGSRVPLILRPVKRNGKDGNRYQLVGGTYLHGFMNGEAVCPSCSGKAVEAIEATLEEIVIE